MKRWLAAFASIAVLVTLVRLAGVRTVWRAWTELPLSAIVASISCYVAALGIRVILWRALLGGSTTSFVRPIVVGSVLGHVLPMKVGDVAPAVLAARLLDLPLTKTLSALTLERVSQLIALIATSFPAAWITLERTNAFPEIRRTALVFLVIVIVVSSGIVVISARRSARSTNRVVRAWNAYATSLRTLLRQPRTLFLTLGLGFVFWMLQYASLWAILRGGGLSVRALDAATVCGAAVIGGTLTAIPLGTQDGISGAVLGALGFPVDRGFALALFHTALSLGCGLLCVLLALRFGRRVVLADVLRPNVD